MRQKEIWEVFFDPVLGSEQGGQRPAVIISGNMVNKNINTIIVCPLTSSLKNYEGNLILQPSERNGLTQTSEVMTIHVRSISKQRFKKKIGSVSNNDLSIIFESLNKILKY
jgi:mRNA interferase MazF